MTTFETTQTRTVETPVAFYVRPSRKNSDAIVIGVEANGDRSRAVLVRLTEDGVRVRSLDGNPREASSNADTQSVLELPFGDLTPDQA